MKKKVLIIAALSAMVIGVLTGCGGKEKEPEEKVYIEESEINSLFTNPDQYKGKYVKMSGQILQAPEKDGEVTAIQVWHDVNNYDQNFIVYTNDVVLEYK